MMRTQIVPTVTVLTAALASKGSLEMEQLVKVQAFSIYSHKTKVEVITQANHVAIKEPIKHIHV